MRLTVETPTPETAAPYGALLDFAAAPPGGALSFASAASDFHSLCGFEAGGGVLDVLSVIYRADGPAVARLEAHLRTWQALVPLDGGAVVQIVALGRARPDPATARAFRLGPLTGLSMRPGCWHATLAAWGAARCLMLSRRETTADLVAHLDGGAPLRESLLAPFAAEVLTPPA